MHFGFMQDHCKSCGEKGFLGEDPGLHRPYDIRNRHDVPGDHCSRANASWADHTDGKRGHRGVSSWRKVQGGSYVMFRAVARHAGVDTLDAIFKKPD